MEDNIQTVIVVIISIFLLFIFPVYMAYEKKDDISYSLAMRYTQDLVDEVRDKGYISKYMYEDYKEKLRKTGNSYDIQLTHEYNRYDPITNYYKIEDNKYTLVKTTTQEERKTYEEKVTQEGIDLGKIKEDSSEKVVNEYIASIYKSQNIDKIEDTYKLSTQVYTTDYIVNILNSERKLLLNSNIDTIVCSDEKDANDGCEYAYIMNVDDNFNVTIKNTNTTLATVVYNMVTANTLDDNTRIYVNYGGTILSSKWYGDVDYAKMKHDNLSLSKFEETVIFEEERHFYATREGGVYPVQRITQVYDGEYVLDFDVKPEEVTELREKGQIRVATYEGYNFAMGNNTASNIDSMLSVSIGINGISLISNATQMYTAKTTAGNEVKLPTYNSELYGNVQRKITDYSSLTVKYVSKGKLEVTLVGKQDVPNHTGTITVTDDSNILNGLNVTTTELDSGVITGTIGTATNVRGTNVNYSINISDTTIGVTATKYVSDESTILSYPTTIDGYVNVRIEMTKTESDKYIAHLYLDDEKVDESIELDVLPKVNIVGKTFIGSEERFFEGYIKNVKIYN